MSLITRISDSVDDFTSSSRLALFGRQLGVQQQLRHAEDAVHRRADFVAHVGQELALGPVGRLGRLLGPLEVLGRVQPIGDVADEGAEGGFVAVTNGGDGQFDGDLLAVATEGLDLDPVVDDFRDAGRLVAAEARFVGLAEGFGDDGLRHQPPDRLRRRVAEHPLGLRIPVGDAAVRAHADDSVERGLHDGVALFAGGLHFVGAFLQGGGPLGDRLFDRGVRLFEPGLAFGDDPHLAAAANARIDEEDVEKRDPAGVLQPPPFGACHETVNRFGPVKPAEEMVGRYHDGSRHHHPPIAIEAQEGQRAEDVEVRLEAAAAQVNQQCGRQHLGDGDHVPREHGAGPIEGQPQGQRKDCAPISEAAQTCACVRLSAPAQVSGEIHRAIARPATH